MPLDTDKTFLINSQTGQKEAISKSLVSEALTSGKYKPSDDLIPFVKADGSKVSADPTELDSLLSQGGRIATRDDIREVQMREEAGKHPIKAALTGLAEGVVPVLPTLLRESAGATPEELRYEREENPYAYYGSQGVGLLGSALLTGGGTAAVKATQIGAKAGAKAIASGIGKATAEKVAQLATEKAATGALGTARSIMEYSPMGLISKAGRAAGEITEKALAEKLGKMAVMMPRQATREIIQKAVNNMAAAGTEGALWGGIQGLDETALGDTDHAAENILYGMGWGSVFGMGLGAVPTAIKGIGAIGRYSLEEAFPTLSSYFSHQPKANIQRAMKGVFTDVGMAMREKNVALTNPDLFNEAIVKTSKEMQAVHELASVNKMKMYDNSPLAEVLKNVDKDAFITPANELADKAMARLQNFRNSTSVIDDNLLKAAEEKIADFKQAVIESWQSKKYGISNPALEVHTAANEAKQRLDALIAWDKLEERNINKKVTKDALKEIRAMLKDFTTDKKVFSDAGLIHGEQNRLYSNWYNANKEYERAFTTKIPTYEVDPVTKRMTVAESKAPLADAKKVKSFFNSFYDSEDTFYNYQKYYDQSIKGTKIDENYMPAFINDAPYILDDTGKKIINPKIFDNLVGFDRQAYEAASPYKKRLMLNNAKISFKKTKDFRRASAFDNLARTTQELQEYNSKMAAEGIETFKINPQNKLINEDVIANGGATINKDGSVNFRVMRAGSEFGDASRGGTWYENKIGDWQTSGYAQGSLKGGVTGVGGKEVWQKEIKLNNPYYYEWRSGTIEGKLPLKLAEQVLGKEATAVLKKGIMGAKAEAAYARIEKAISDKLKSEGYDGVVFYWKRPNINEIYPSQIFAFEGKPAGTIVKQYDTKFKYTGKLYEMAAEKELAHSAEMRKMFKPVSGISPTEALGGMAGMSLFGMPATFGIGTIYHILKNPKVIISMLHQSEKGYKMFRDMYLKIPAAAREIGTKSIRKLAVAEGAIHTVNANHAFDSSKAYEKNSKEIRDYVQNPSLLTQKTSQAVADISEVVPNLAVKLQGIANTGIAFLNSKLPNLGTKNGWIMSDKPIEPSSQEKAKWLRYFKAVTEPQSVIQDAHNGIITDEGVETFKAVYPRLLGELQTGIMEHLAKSKEEPDYKTRMVLDKFFDNQIDADNKIDYLNFVQGLTQQAAQQEAQKPKMGTKPIEVVGSQNRAATDKLLTRR